MPKNKKFHCDQKFQLVMIKSQADQSYWDSHWNKIKVGFIGESAKDYIRMTKKYLPAGSGILEGGCGLCGKLIALKEAGYKVSGVDFAEGTVSRVLEKYPELDVRIADVRNLPYEDNIFDAYWSFGVIEHFWNGYNDILVEARRVLRPGGFLFMTFPGMSNLRKIKARLRCYSIWDSNSETEPDGFYQYILNRENVCENLERQDFEILESFQHNIKSGIKQELRLTWHGLRLIDKATPFLSKRVIAELSEKLLGPFAGHVSVVVARKK